MYTSRISNYFFCILVDLSGYSGTPENLFIQHKFMISSSNSLGFWLKNLIVLQHILSQSTLPFTIVQFMSHRCPSHGRNSTLLYPYERRCEVFEFEGMNADELRIATR